MRKSKEFKTLLKRYLYCDTIIKQDIKYYLKLLGYVYFRAIPTELHAKLAKKKIVQEIIGKKTII